MPRYRAVATRCYYEIIEIEAASEEQAFVLSAEIVNATYASSSEPQEWIIDHIEEV